MAFQWGKEDATNRVHLNKHVYLLHTYTGNNTHACSKAMKTRMHLFYEGCGTGQRHERGEALQPSTIIDVQALQQFYLPGHGATTFIQKKSKEQTTLKNKGVRLDLLGLYGVGPGRPNGSRETEQVTCTLEVPRWGESRRLSPRQLV